MKIKKVNLLMLSVLAMMFLSCSKDDGPSNTAPVVQAATFTVDETATGQIGTVTVNDANGDELTVTVSTNHKDLYEITNAGVLSLKAGNSLDGEASHTIAVSAYDGTLSGNNTITINVNNVNKAPVPEEGQVFEVEENVEGASIGQVVVTDEDGQELTFEIIDAQNGPFVITADGMLSVDAGKALDYESTDSYTITLSVTDGTEAVQFTITVNVLDDMVLAESPNSFITTWTTDADNVEIELNEGVFTAEFTFDYSIDWGDGSAVENLETGNPKHVYTEAGTYTIAILGAFPAFDSNQTPELTSMEQWGNVIWQYLESAFVGLDTYNASDTPNLTNVTSLARMFLNPQMNFEKDIIDWNVSSVTDMSSMFEQNVTFNQNIGSWDVSNVVNMTLMFSGATLFDQNLGKWNITNVTDMPGMLDNSGLSPQNFGDTIKGWVKLGNDNIQDGVTFGADNIDFCSPDNDLLAALLNLTDDNGWTINAEGGAQVICD